MSARRRTTAVLLGLLLIGLSPLASWGQIAPLPAIDTTNVASRLEETSRFEPPRLATVPNSALPDWMAHTQTGAEPTMAVGDYSLTPETALEAGRIHPTPYKSAFFQKLEFTGSWIDAGGPSGLGISTAEISFSVALPAPTVKWPLVITHGFNVYWLDEGDASPDLPPRVHDAYLDFMWLPRISERLTLMIAVSPGWYSDFQTGNSDALRVTGRGLALFEWFPERLQVVGGVVYLDRDDIPLLPAVGLVWTPTPDFKAELLFPRPKLGYRLRWDGMREDWLYLGGELGGGNWAIERADGSPDTVAIRDLRLFVGWQRLRDGGAGHFVEVGYAFARSVEYGSATPDFEPDDALFIQAGLSF